MRCTCCNAPFSPAIIRVSGVFTGFEEMCSSCRGKTNTTTYSPDWEHESISEKPIQLYD